MEEEIRVTTQRKSKKIVTILLIVTGILGVALIAVAVYFYSIKDTQNSNTTTSTTTCGCYYIDPAVSSGCGDPRLAFQFETLTVPSTQTCKASCTTNNISTNLLNSTTEQDLYQICQLTTITDARCKSMTITDKDGKIVTGRIDSTNQLNIEAVFDQEYSNYKFTINNETTEPDVISTDKLTIKKTITDLSDSTAINVVATGTTSDEQQINSPICRRLIEISKPGTATVSSLSLQTVTEDKVLKISNAKIATGVLSSSNIKISFTFGDTYPELIMTKGFTTDSSAGVIEVIQQDLYNAANFSNASSFSQLNSHTGDLAIKAEVFVDNTSIGSASQTVTFPSTDDTNTETPTVESSFTVTNTVNQTCVERVSPSNTAQYTINITNKGTTSQNITSVTDKLPLGFEYSDGTTKLNGVSVADSGYVTVSTVGDTKQLVISKSGGWTLSANQSLSIVFQAVAGANALTGANLNEVVVTPEQVPTDPSTLRTSANLAVAQDCDNPTKTDNTPQTGIFDTLVFKIFVGIAVVALGWYIYNRPQGQLIAAKVVDSEIFKNTELNTWRIFKPKKYFEEVVIRKSQKR